MPALSLSSALVAALALWAGPVSGQVVPGTATPAPAATATAADAAAGNGTGPSTASAMATASADSNGTVSATATANATGDGSAAAAANSTAPVAAAAPAVITVPAPANTTVAAPVTTTSAPVATAAAPEATIVAPAPTAATVAAPVTAAPAAPAVGTGIPLGYMPTQQDRLKLAAHTIGVNMAYYEAQRAGNIPNDSMALFPNVWEWKRPGYVNACSDFMASLSPEDRAGVDFPNNAGFFEAGNSVLVTGPSAFTATQRAIGALQFMPQLEAMTPGAFLGDPAGCMRGNFTTTSLKTLLLRQVRYEAATLSNSIVKSRANNSDFAILIGVADSSTYEEAAYPSWLAPPAYQQKCYFADMTHPAADVAAQAATGLALAAKVLATHGDEQDKANAAWYGIEAARAFEYAKLMWRVYGEDSICSRTVASTNCIGSGCTKLDEVGDPVKSPCVLYLNSKPPLQYLFVASTALYALTGSSYYRYDADYFWPTESPDLLSFLYNWNNVVSQGVVILSSQPDFPGAARPRDFYRGLLRAAVSHWARCSNSGATQFFDTTFCQRTADGSAYPLSMPWGSLGTTMNGMCAVGTYQMLGYDAVESPLRKSAACFMQRQLGYIFNHKCQFSNSSCNTPDSEGFSYMVGFGSYYPTHVHSRDAAYPHFPNNTHPDGSTLCGALVAGPYGRTATDPEWGPVAAGTDVYANNRNLWFEAEPAIDYTSSLVCTMMAYVNTPDTLFADCPARTAFTGRLLF